MLKKLLKYDLRAVFKYWWVAALSTLALAVVCGFSLGYIGESISGESSDLLILAWLGMILSIIGISAFLVASEVFLFVRYYQNFFSDEGYLTFTLPVKRHQLLNSKIISAVIVEIATIGVIAIDALIALTIASENTLFSSVITTYIRELIVLAVQESFELLGFWAWIYLVEIIVCILGVALLAVLLVYTVITFASMITKKNKVLVAIGIYYGVSSVFSFIMQVVFTVSIIGSPSWLEILPTESISWLLAIVLLGFAALALAACVAAYAFVLWMLDRKLNLA